MHPIFRSLPTHGLGHGPAPIQAGLNADVPQPSPDTVPLPPSPHPVPLTPDLPPEITEPTLPGHNEPVGDPVEITSPMSRRLH